MASAIPETDAPSICLRPARTPSDALRWICRRVALLLAGAHATMTIAITQASSPAQFDQFAQIIAEYLAWLRHRYRDQAWMIDQVSTEQSLDDELGHLATKYSLPLGMGFLVEVDGALAGAGAWRRLDKDVCEMKRVFIREAFMGQGAGRRLCEAILQSARAHGYALMRLDTGKRMTEAQGLYRKLGFRSCEPYLHYPANIQANMIFMQATVT